MATVPKRPELGPTLAVSDKEHLKVTVCENWEELERWRDDWESLLAENPDCSIFQTSEWLGAWWRAFGNGRQLAGLIFLDLTGRVHGIAPLYYDGSGKHNELRLVGAGSGDSDALDLLARPSSERSVAQTFVAWLAQEKQWKTCSLETLPRDSKMARHLTGLVQQAGWTLLKRTSVHSFIDFPATWDEYLKRLEQNFRPLLTRYPKRLQSRFNVNIFRCERAADLESRLQDLFALHQMRWTERREPGAFSSAERRKFYSHMATAFLRRGWLEFWLLTLENEAVAAQFCFRYRDTVSLLQEGFNPKYAPEKVGYALRAHAFQELIRTGAKRYDFLGGADQYKLKFAAQQNHYLDLHFAGPSLAGRARLVRMRLMDRLKQWLKGKLPERAVAGLRRVVPIKRPSIS